MGIREAIPIAKPFLGEEEGCAVRKVILSGWVTQGPKVKQFEDDFASYVGSRDACAVSSCTAALHIALLIVGVKPGDVVVTVSHSFIATANSVRHCGAEPVFVDINPDTFNMSAECLKRCLEEDCEIRNQQLFYKNVTRLITDQSPLRYFFIKGRSSPLTTKLGRVAAIMPVHQMGMPCNLSAILPVARKFNIPVIEDAACAIGSELSLDNGKTWEKIGKPHSDISCFSFHPRKIITTGDGGMLTTNNPDYGEKFRLFRHHGMSISDLARHSSQKVLFEKYVLTGYNYRMTDIQAAVGIEQLKKLPKILAERRKIANIYLKELQDISWLRLPCESAHGRTNWQSFPVRLLKNAPLSRQQLMQLLLDAGISTRPGVMNAHQEKPYSSDITLEISELARDAVILLPLFAGIKKKQIDAIVKLIKNA